MRWLRLAMRRSLVLAVFTLPTAGCDAAKPSGAELSNPTTEAHYSPVENLERIDVATIATARRSIDMAAYVLSDYPVIDALIAAQARGVVVRIVLDRTQRHAWPRLVDLAPNIRIKPSRVFMHLKSYAVDGELLRAGAANFSASGLKRQDNDLVLIRDGAAVRTFEADYERLWREGFPALNDDVATREMSGTGTAQKAIEGDGEAE